MKRLIPTVVLLCGIAWLIAALRVEPSKSGFDANGFGRLPVLSNGRLKPMDTVARTTLLMLRTKQTVRADGKTLSASEWLMDVLLRPSQADKYKTFIITHPDVLGILGQKQAKEKYFSFAEIEPHLKEIESQAALADEVVSGSRNLFQREIIKLRTRLITYARLKNSIHNDESVDFKDELAVFQKSMNAGIIAFKNQAAGKEFNKEDLGLLADFFERYEFQDRLAAIRPVPKADAQDWQTIGHSLLASLRDGQISPAVTAYAAMSSAWRKSDATAFNQAVADYRASITSGSSAVLRKTNYEFLFNHFEPFYQCMLLYVCVFLLALISWLVWPESLGKSALWLLILVFVVHTIGLLSRMYLQGRPPVTNLYSSAIFVGWGACGLCIVLEKIYRNGIGSITAALMGVITLFIAHHLSFEGDTMEMLRAVLDTNLWLATHVVVITIGYSATFLAGFLALLFIVRGFFTRSLDAVTAKSLNRMVYGILCFATLFSFVGTILGGIWADQSWGRFWGFDTKENGALMIVIWNAIILHARWGGFIRERGLMNLAVFGNVVTSFSWFGVNMLGVGLHSYGFMDQAFFWLIAFDVTMLAFILLGTVPLRHWRSFAANAK